MSKPTITLAAAAVAAAAFSAPASAATCADMLKLALPDTKITTAETVSGTFTPPGPQGPGPGSAGFKVPEICRVAGVVSPKIKFEVWLPTSAAWNGKLQSVGGGGLAGIISYPALALAVNAGYASASTDTGHEASAADSGWVDERQRVIDYGYRAIHEMTLKAKAVIDAYYGKAPRYSYFNGCSTGGRQGLMEAQRFPDDYDGIISGAPVNTFTRLHMGQLWTAHATLAEPNSVLTRDDLATAKWPLVRQPFALETSLPGVFAVGDVRSGSVKRVASAVGEGSISIAAVHQVLAS